MNKSDRYMPLLLAAGLITILTLSISAAQGGFGRMDASGMMGSDGRMMEMMRGMGSANFIHDAEDIEWMKSMMKGQMNMTDEEVKEMTEHCPMMR